MHQSAPSPNRGLIRQPALCQWLDVSRNSLIRLQAKDPTFPRPIKDGDSRQAAVFYVMAEVEAWLQAQIAKRDNVQEDGDQQ